MPNGKFFQATEMESGVILGMVDEWKGRKYGWSRVRKGKNVVTRPPRQGHLDLLD